MPRPSWSNPSAGFQASTQTLAWTHTSQAGKSLYVVITGAQFDFTDTPLESCNFNGTAMHPMMRGSITDSGGGTSIVFSLGENETVDAIGTITFTTTDTAAAWAGIAFNITDGPVNGSIILGGQYYTDAFGVSSYSKSGYGWDANGLQIGVVFGGTSAAGLALSPGTTIITGTNIIAKAVDTTDSAVLWTASRSSVARLHLVTFMIPPGDQSVTGGSFQPLFGLPKDISSLAAGSSFSVGLPYATNAGRGREGNIIPVPGTIRSIAAYTNIAPGVGKQVTLKLRRGRTADGTSTFGSMFANDTGVSVTISGTNTSAVLDGLNIPIYRYECLSWKIVNDGGSALPASMSLQPSLLLECGEAGEQVYGGGGMFTSTGGTVSPLHPYPAGWGFDATTGKGLVGIAGNITELLVPYQVSTTVVDDHIFYLVLNGVTQDGTGGTVNTRAALPIDTASQSVARSKFTLPVVPGDLVSVISTEAGGSALLRASPIIKFVATTPGEFMLSGYSDGGGTTFFSVPNEERDLDAATEAGMKIIIPPLTSVVDNALHITGIRVHLTTAPGATKSRTATFRKNGADSAIAVTISNTAVDGTASGDVSHVGSDLISLGWTGVNTPTASHEYWSIPGFITAAALGEIFQKVTQVVLLVGYEDDAEEPPVENACSGGGTVASGSNPSDGASLAAATALHAKVTTTIGATSYSWAKVAINNATPSTVRVDSIQKINVGIGLNGGLEGVAATITLLDHDNLLRGLHATQTMLNQSMSIWTADQATIDANGNWWRLFRGVIRKFRPTGDGKYTITLEDPLSLSTSEFAQDKMVPVDLISINDGTSDQNLRQAPLPIAYGSINEEGGAWLADYVGTETLIAHLSLGSLHKHLICKSPTGDVQSVHIGDPFSGTPPRRRAPAGASEYGTRIFVEHQTGWLFADQYVVDPDTGIRLSVIYIEQHHPGADLARFGRIPILVNFCGREDIGDGLGNTIDKLVLQDLHFLNTEVAQHVLDADWPAIAQRDSYALFNTASWAAVAAIFEARLGGNGALGATVIGHSHKQISLRDRLEQASCYGYFERFWSRHGQMMVTTLNRNTPTIVTHFTAVLDIKENSFTIDPCDDQVENLIQYVYRRKYAPTLEQQTPSEGARLPPDAFQEDWLSGLQEDPDATSIAALASGTSDDGIRRSKVLELECVRDQATAEDVARQRRMLRAPKNGRPEATFTVQLQRAYNIELGDIVQVTHPQGLGVNGWVGQRCQVRRRIVDLDLMEVTLVVRDVDDLLPIAAGGPTETVTWDADALTWDGVFITWT